MIGRRAGAAALSLATSTLIALAAIAVSIAVIAIAGHSPGDSLQAIWDGAFGGREQVAGTLEKMIESARRRLS